MKKKKKGRWHLSVTKEREGDDPRDEEGAKAGDEPLLDEFHLVAFLVVEEQAGVDDGEEEDRAKVRAEADDAVKGDIAPEDADDAAEDDAV